MRKNSSPKKSAAPYDDLARAIHSAIDLLESTKVITAEDADADYGHYNGYCARACSAYSCLA